MTNHIEPAELLVDGSNRRAVKSIRIKNFKSLQDIEFDLSDLTFFFGTNDSGKSSAFEALLFAAANLSPSINVGQTIYKIDNETDLGSFKEIVTFGNTEKDISIELCLQGSFNFCSKDFFNSLKRKSLHDFKKIPSRFSKVIDYDIELIFTFSKDDRGCDLYSIKVKDRKDNSEFKFVCNENNVKLGLEEKKHWKINRISERKNSGVENIFSFHEYEVKLNDTTSVKFKNLEHKTLHNSEYNLLEGFGLDWKFEDFLEKSRDLDNSFFITSLENGKKKSNFWETIGKDSKQTAVYELFCKAFLIHDRIREELIMLSKLRHMPTTRQVPPKINLLKNNNFNEGEYYGILKLIHSNYLNNKKGFRSFRQTINNELKNFGFDVKLDYVVKKELSKIQFKDKRCEYSISDMSSGFIQIFPVIIYCSINSAKDLYSTLLIEQPELHLHPKLQCHLANLFVDVIKNSTKALIIETHSEHLIRKIQVLIAKGEIAKEKVGVLYFKKSDGITRVEKMEIGENGLFKNDWPDGFFDDSVDLTMELFEAVRKRKN